MTSPDRADIIQALQPVMDPDLEISIVDLGLIYGVDLAPDPAGEGVRATIRMTLTSPGCPLAEELMAAVREAARGVPGVAGAQVQLVWSPPWDPREMASDEAKDELDIW